MEQTKEEENEKCIKCGRGEETEGERWAGLFDDDLCENCVCIEEQKEEEEEMGRKLKNG